MVQQFTDKVVLITGGGSGIGKATAIRFGAEGAKVIIGNRNEQAGQEVVKKITDAGGIASFKKTDVTKAEDVKALVDHTVSLYGRLDAAFNNAGTEGTPSPLAEDTEENFHHIFDANVKGVWLSMKYEIETMLSHGGGSIVNVSSIAGLIGFPQLGMYTASKHAVLGLTKAAAIEYGSQGIRINAVSPAAIETDMLNRFAGGGSPEEKQQTLDGMKAMHPIGRLGKPEEIAGAVIWLCSDDASFMLGQSVTVDGGFTAI